LRLRPACSNEKLYALIAHRARCSNSTGKWHTLPKTSL